MSLNDLFVLLAYVDAHGYNDPNTKRDLRTAYLEFIRKPVPSCCGGNVKYDRIISELRKHHT